MMNMHVQFHAVPLSGDDSDLLAEERNLNDLCGPSALVLYQGEFPQGYPRLNPQLAWVHEFLLKTWRDTGESVD
jgi:hypothetical protein